jgi:hypothetical protein
LNKREAIKSWISRSVEAFRRVVEEEAQEGNDIAFDDRASSIVIIVFSALIGSYLVGHQTRSTGFFTATFGTLEMLLLYGALVFWIATSTLILIGRKNLSRDLDSFGGLFFVTVGNVWLLVVFPFEFAFFCRPVAGFPQISGEVDFQRHRSSAAGPVFHRAPGFCSFFRDIACVRLQGARTKKLIAWSLQN